MRQSLEYYTYEDISLDPYGHDAPGFNGCVLTHLGLHNSENRNAGDSVIPQALRGAFDRVAGPFGWRLRQIWEPFEDADVQLINDSSQGVLVGSGGFIIRDQQGASIARSGWLWNITEECFAGLRGPLFLFGLGYNRFRGQPDFDPHFSSHISKVVDKARFVGMRNQGSIRQLRRYMTSSALADKLQLQFCPTISSWQIWPEVARMAEEFDAARRERPVLALNFAYDRPHLRFGDEEDRILKELARAVRRMEQEAGWEIVLTAHKVIDRALEIHLDGAGVSYRTVDLTEAPFEKVLEHYARCDLAIGMRGHGQMIPFGLRRPIISLISHNKMGYFLEDIEHLEWGVEMAPADLDGRLYEKFQTYAVDNHTRSLAEVAAAQQKVWELTRRNIAFIAGELGLKVEGE
jgi:polysaccharide pyruvyl transferase WcaK-like protein